MASSSLRELHNRSRRNAAATIASFSFLLLLLILSIALFATRRGDHAHHSILGMSTFSATIAPPPTTTSSSSSSSSASRTSCEAELRSLPDAPSRCGYLTSQTHAPCAPRGYVHYLRVFYCGFGGAPWLGAAALGLWLLLLFYLLGDTASRYFCATLEGLSAALRLPPAIAGVTLLSLGNGAPDVLSSVVAFASSSGGDGSGGVDDADAGDVGLSSVLGGALFVSTVVAGVVAIVAGGSRGHVEIERSGFVRDVCFLLVALGYLLAVLLAGEVSVWVAASFLSLYAAYVLLVWTSHCCAATPDDDDDKPKPVAVDADLAAPLLLNGGDVDGEESPPELPISSSKHTTDPSSSSPRRRRRNTLAGGVLDALQWPLNLPRRLTIPDIAAHRWSKPYAVSSALLSPILLAAISSSPSSAAEILAGAIAGTILAAAAFRGTSSASPPATRWRRLPWLAGGFLMSVLWSYMLARELVALLVSIGLVAGVRTSVLGATVLAWGNSLGDLVADVAMAMHEHDDGPAAHGGAQTAIAGCYAGPAFNTVVGLGLSLTLAAGARFPEPYAVPADASAYQAAGFLAAGLVWALVVLPARGMRLDRVLGVGLLLIYLAFLGVRLGSMSLGAAIGGGS